MEILATPSNKVYGLHSCPVHLVKSVRHSLSPLLAALMNKSISTGIYPHLLKHAKVIPVYKIHVITAQFPYFRSSIDCLRN